MFDNKMLLIGMPWIKPDHLSIQLGGLKAYLEQYGNRIETRHYYKDILAYIPQEVYYNLYEAEIGEYIALALLFPEKRETIAAYVNKRLKDNNNVDGVMQQFELFVEHVLEDILSIRKNGYSLIGFSVSLQQIVTSLLVAERLKLHDPSVVTIFGGAIMLDDMGAGLMKHFPFIDMICCGEGEETLRQLLAGDDIRSSAFHQGIPNLTYRTGDQISANQQADLIEMCHLPIPDYTDYFQHSLRDNDVDLYPKISIETSRGCFYGKCSFCNLNAQWLTHYRSKSAAQVYEEIRTLTNKHQTLRILFADSNVSNRSDLFQLMAKDTCDYHCWAEVSGHLKKDAVVLMRKAGVEDIQIGIESFSDRLLKDLNKGVGLMRNIEMLKWCAEYRFELFYNIIVGYPSETDQDVNETLRTMAFTRYFQPPNISGYVLSIESPIYRSMDCKRNHNFSIPESSRALIPSEYVEVIAPLLSTVVGYEVKSLSPAIDSSAIYSAVQRWEAIYQRNGRRPSLLIREGDGFGVITDRSLEVESHKVLDNEAMTIYMVCMDESRTVDEVLALTGISDRDLVESILEELAEEEVLFSCSGRYFSLAIKE